jgi:acetylornithine deacetylase/succinyl-diaminopimelate desuccinylase-like protein
MAIGIGLENLRAYLEKNKPRHIERIQRAIRQPSVSTENHGVRECAELLVEQHKEVGFQEATVVETGGLPGLWAYYNAGASKTIVVYGNFDTRPVLPHEKWEHPAYSGDLTSSGSYGQVLIGRGAVSYKGPYVAWLNSLEALIAVEGTLPVNVMVLLEGDEILGSPYYREMMNKYGDRLATADVSLSPGASQDASGRVTMNLGYKGMIYAELMASGVKWGRGPQAGPLHGMAKSVVDSPVWRLVHALSTLTESDGNRIAVKGFYDQLTPPTEAEVSAARAFRDGSSGQAWNQVLPGVAAAPAPAGDLGDEETILNFFYGPSMNINGMKAGFIGPGTLPFSLPNEASARFDIRMPRGYKAQTVVQQIKDHLVSKGYGDLDFNAMGAFDPSNQDRKSGLVRSLVQAFEQMEVPLAMPPCSGGGGPWSLFTTELGIPMVRSVGVGGGGGMGGANEFLVIDGDGKLGGLVECELSHMHILKSYAEVG